MSENIYLQLEDGTLFQGKHFGAVPSGDVIAEVVFTTAMTGYVETLTDPSYYGQMVVQTFPLMGNYGISAADFESKKVHLSAYIVRDLCDSPSNFRCKSDLDSFLKEQNIPGIYDIDTRALTKKIRTKGVMNARLSFNCPDKESASSLSAFQVTDAVSNVSCKESYEITTGLPGPHVVLWDFGAKENIQRKLHSLGMHLTIVPSTATCQEILSLKPDGIMLSNGPGNPKENVGIIEELRKICTHKLPIFGICLGHQLLALANGGDTEKLKYGHRGANQPVQDTRTGKVYITSQNHGYAVRCDALPTGGEISFVNLNDNTCEGLVYKNFPGFSVQFHPEACGGPHDTEFLFREFAALMKGGNLCH